MKAKIITLADTKKHLHLLENTKYSKDITSLIRNLEKGTFALANFLKNEEIVNFGVLNNESIMKNKRFQYGKVPLGVILSGEIIVIEDGKAVKRLVVGEFIGLFETGFYFSCANSRRIGKWSLIADENTVILFFGNNFTPDFRKFIIDLARVDIVPKPITDLPLLDWIANKITKSLLDDTLILAHTHILPSSFAFFRHLAHLVSYNNLFILEKPYSTIRPIFNRIVQMGVEIIPAVMTPHSSYELSLRKSTDVFWDKIVEVSKKKRIKRIVIVDDGAELFLSIPWDRLKGIKIVGIEQTQRGIDRVENSLYKIPPIVSVASSSIKKNFESQIIGKAIVDKIRNLGLLDSRPRVGIIGIGSIGSAINKELKKNNLTTLNYDITHHISKTESEGRLTSIDTIFNRSDIIIGCSGTDFLKGVALEKISGNKILVSASSTDIEFFSLLNIAAFFDTSFETVELQVHPKLKVQILNGGYPINFDRVQEWEPAEDIQITRCLLYMGFIQALNLDSKYPGKIIGLDRRFEQLLLEKWLGVKDEQYTFMKRDPNIKWRNV